MPNYPREEIEATVARYVEVRNQIDAKEASWDALLPFFTDDVVFIDPAWGRVQGIDAVRTFLEDSMAGLDDWSFPVEFTAIAGDNVVVKWTEVIPGTRADGSPTVQSGSSRLIYAGDGKFRYEEDVLNMVHVMDDLRGLAWTPPEGMSPPPRSPVRDFTRPA
jgi:ketosteroid isomerase-like protein